MHVRKQKTIYIYTYTYKYVHTYLALYLYTHTYLGVYIYIYSTYVSIYTHIHVFIYMYTYTYIHIYMYSDIQIYMYACIFTHIHVFMHIYIYIYSLQGRCTCGNKLPCDGDVMITKNEQGKLEYHKIPRHWIGPAHAHEVRQVCMYVNMCTYLYIYIYIYIAKSYIIYIPNNPAALDWPRSCAQSSAGMYVCKYVYIFL